MGLVRVEPVRLDVPNDPGAWIEIRQLAWRRLKDARKAAAAEQREEMKALGAEFLTAIIKGNTDDESRLQRKMRELEYDLSNFDQETLLKKGVAAWSYTVSLDADGDWLDAIDETTARWAAEQILKLSKPPSEAEQKNG